MVDATPLAGRVRRRRLLALAAAAVPVAGRAQGPEVPAVAPGLTAAQRDWLGARPPIRWLPEQDYAPFVWVGDDGVARGLSVAILSRIAHSLGLRLDQLPARPLREQLALARQRQGDLVTSLRATPERSAYLLFTRPYASVPTVLVVRRAPGGPPRGDATRLATLDGRPVAVGSGFAVEATVRAAYPAVDWRGVPSDQVALEGVADGRFAAAVVDAASGGHLMAQPGLQALQAVADVGFRYELSFAVRSDWPVLRDILDQGIAALPRADMVLLRQQWLSARPQEAEPRRAPLATGVGVALLAAGGLGAAALVWRQRRQAAAGPGGDG